MIFKRTILVVLFLVTIKIDAQEYSIKNLTTKNGLPSNIVYDIQQDKIGYLWIATEKGLVKFDGDDFTLINTLRTTSLFIDEHTIYAGQDKGLFVKNRSEEKYYKSPKILSIAIHKNEVFVGTIEGLYSLKNDKLKPIKLNSILDFSSINTLIPSKNDIIISSSNGLYKINNTLENNNLQKIKEGNFTSISKIYNDFLIVKSNDEICTVKNDSVMQIIETFDNITSIKKLKNEVWVTSKTEGIEVFVLPSFFFKQKINKYNSLQTNTIYNVFRDRENTTYLASNKGIYILENTSSQSSSYIQPNIYFENLQINHQKRDTLLVKKDIMLSAKENNIAISFKTVNLLNPKKIKYRYQLQNEFSPWSSNTTIQLPNLKASQYTLKIQSKINDNVSTIKSFSFTIDSPLYKKAWFIFSIVIIILLAAYLFLDYYISRINTIHKEKVKQLKLQNSLLTLEQKALQLQMNPHFIFNVLNGIKALGNSGNTVELNKTISKFSILLRGILNNSRKEEITLHEEITLLKNYIELEQRMSSKSFTYMINSNLNNIDPEEILIPTMLIQPFVENSIHHAFNKDKLGEISINFDVKHRFLYVTIIDNGIGIFQSQQRKRDLKHKSIALEVTKERLLTIDRHNTFTIKEIKENKKVKGTEVSFRIILKTDY